MPYIGKNLVGVLREPRSADTMTGDGSDTTLTLTDTPGSTNNVLVFLDGIRQTPVTDYTVMGNILTFTTAPEAGVLVVAITGSASSIDPKMGSVTSSKIVDGMVGSAKIDTMSASKLTGALPAISGTNLTNVDATTGIDNVNSDPAVTTNPAGGVGTIQLNQVSGEMFVCTDATTNLNVWKNIGEGSGSVQKYITATGGTVTTDGDYKVHTFNSSGLFIPTIGNDASLGNTLQYLVIAGGGGGGGAIGSGGGGGGAGGYRSSVGSENSGRLSSTESVSTVTSQSYVVTVGGGGTGGAPASGTRGNQGSFSAFNTIRSIGGGGGGGSQAGADEEEGGVGGSGGGAGATGSQTLAAGAGTAGQGFDGAPAVNRQAPNYGSSGGGGAGSVGVQGTDTTGGNGGDGISSSVTGSAVLRAGGGGGATYNGGTGGTGQDGGGNGGNPTGSTAGTVNSGGGGGGTSSSGDTNGGTGGSGVVIIRYKFQ